MPGWWIVFVLRVACFKIVHSHFPRWTKDRISHLSDEMAGHFPVTAVVCCRDTHWQWMRIADFSLDRYNEPSESPAQTGQDRLWWSIWPDRSLLFHNWQDIRARTCLIASLSTKNLAWSTVGLVPYNWEPYLKPSRCGTVCLFNPFSRICLRSA
jgi:hypothetical protein